VKISQEFLSDSWQ